MQCQPRGVTRDVRGHVWVTEQQGTSFQRGCLACPLSWPTSCRTLPSSTTSLPFLTAGRRWLRSLVYCCVQLSLSPPPTPQHTYRAWLWLVGCLSGAPGAQLQRLWDGGVPTLHSASPLSTNTIIQGGHTSLQADCSSSVQINGLQWHLCHQRRKWRTWTSIL